MCGRYTLGKSAEAVIERFGVQELKLELAPRFNIAPTQAVPVVVQNGGRTLEAFRWGLVPSWAKDASIGDKMINARAETIAEKPSFKNALLRRRCLIPADGFYEWKRDGKTKQPMHIHARSSELFAFAGLWEEWKQPDGAPLRTCTIITTTPNDLMADIHDRMPVILRREDEAAWLETEWRDVPGLLNLLRPYPHKELAAYPVATLVNSPGFDAPDCIASLADD